MNISVFVVCMVILLCCVHSEANNCSQPFPCPTHPHCYCHDGSRIKFNCQLQALNCGCPPLLIPQIQYTQGRKIGDSYTVKTQAQYTSAGVKHTCLCTKKGWTGGRDDSYCGVLHTTVTTTKATTRPSATCPNRLSDLDPFIEISYSKQVEGGFLLGAEARYRCEHESSWRYASLCTIYGWTHFDHTCSCLSPSLTYTPESWRNIMVEFNTKDKRDDRYPFGTIATYYCRKSDGRKEIIETVTCLRRTGKWSPSLNSRNCYEPVKTTAPMKYTVGPRARETTEAPLHHKDERTLVIVSGTTGAILGALIILVVVVSCQRRLHYHRMRRARLRHRQDQDAFTAFITYHRDVRLMLPSYDEAMNQHEQEPPSFEEALGHYEEPSLPPGHTPASESPPSSTPSDSTASPGETRNSPDDDTDTTPLDGQSSVSPPGNTRLIRSLRALFGGRAFRTDAIYCRFVPQEDENESDQNAERDSRNPTEDADDAQLSDVLARAGLC